MSDHTPGPTSHTYFSQRLRLHYVDWGNASKPPLLLLHGGRDHCRNWDWTAAALRDRYHVIAPDLRGHGDSQNEDGTYSWKFDNYVRTWPPYDMRLRDIELLFSRIACPTLLLYGKESRFGSPADDGRAAPFRHATVVGVDGAGHWLHHD